jgi:hypothetical protein
MAMSDALLVGFKKHMASARHDEEPVARTGEAVPPQSI